jgi:hypothetical protein
MAEYRETDLKLTIGDRILFGFLVAAVVASYSLVGTLTSAGTTVFVETDGEMIYKADLRTRSSFSVEGTTGTLLVDIDEDGVAIVEAQCPNHLCIRMGRRRKAGEVIVCVPNKTIVRIEGPSGPEVRATTG